MLKGFAMVGSFIMTVSLPLALGCVAGERSVDAGPDISQDFASVRSHGAQGDGAADDSAAIQAAVDTGKNVYFPSGQYRITRPIRVTGSGQTLFSYGRNQFAGSKAASTIRVADDLQGPVFAVEAHKVMFLGLSIHGPGKTSRTTAILYNKPYNSDDVDGMVIGCGISHLGVGINIVGRGLRVERSIFASITEVVKIDWPTENVTGEGLQVLPYGMRAFFFSNNRVHTCSTFVVNEGPKSRHLWGLSLTGNLLDIGDALFRGSATYSNISNNTICHTRRTPIYFKELCHSTVIANNVISGGDSPDGKRPACGIWFEGACHDVTINGNTFANIRHAGILFNADTQEHVVVNANIFNQIGLDNPSGRSVINFAKPAKHIAINANSFRPGANGAAVVISAPQGALNAVEMAANTCEDGKVLIRETRNHVPENEQH